MSHHQALPRVLLCCCALAAALVGAGLVAPTAATADEDLTVRAITFPVGADAAYTPDFRAPRSGGRQHAGADIFAPKLTPVVAARDGVVDRLSTADLGRSGNYVVIVDADGWEYVYVHLNNDSPDTDDGRNPPEWILGPDIEQGATVAAGQLVGYLGDSGNAENTPPHLHFEIRRPGRVPLNPWPSLRAAQGVDVGDQCVWSRNPSGRPSDASGSGLWTADAQGTVATWGGAGFFGDMTDTDLNGEVLGLTPTRTGLGYWMVGTDGGIFSFGDATFHGSTGSLVLNEPVVGMAATPAGDGYWLVASDGGIFAFGSAGFHGSTGSLRLNEPVVGMVPTATGGGYLLVAEDGGVFAFGDAEFQGSLPGLGIVETVVGVAVAPGNVGYWVLTVRGGIYPFGDVAWHGSVQAAGHCLTRRAAAIAATATGEGYWILTTDGRVWSFGDASRFDPPVSTAGGAGARALAGVAPVDSSDGEAQEEP